MADPVAITALGLSGVLAIWEFAKRGIDGARVRVRMHAGLYTPSALSKSTKSWANLVEMTRGKWGWPTEVAIIEIENPGREAVTISDISLDFGWMYWWKPWWRRHAAPYPWPGHGAVREPSFRMEPFDRAIVIIDVWHVLQPVDHHAFALPERPFPLRASVRVAGRRGAPCRRGASVGPSRSGKFRFSARRSSRDWRCTSQLSGGSGSTTTSRTRSTWRWRWRSARRSLWTAQVRRRSRFRR